MVKSMVVQLVISMKKHWKGNFVLTELYSIVI